MNLTQDHIQWRTFGLYYQRVRIS